MLMTDSVKIEFEYEKSTRKEYSSINSFIDNSEFIGFLKYFSLISNKIRTLC